jgi:hypothetical protein
VLDSPVLLLIEQMLTVGGEFRKLRTAWSPKHQLAFCRFCPNERFAMSSVKRKKFDFLIA